MRVTGLIKLLIMVFAVLAALNIFFAVQATRVQEQMREAYEEKFELTTATYNFNIVSMQLTRYARVHATRAYAGTYDIREPYIRYHDWLQDPSIENLLPIFEERNAPDNEIEMIQNARAHSSALRRREAEVFEAVAEGRAVDAIHLMYGAEIKESLTPLDEMIDALGNAVSRRALESVASANNRARIYSTLSIVVSILFALASIIGTVVLLRTVKRAMYQVSETAKLNKEEERLREVAEEESLAKTKFLAQMSHEIRTPMNAVLGIAEIELLKGNHPRETEEALLRIHSSSRLLLTLINDILDLSKVEAGKMEIVPIAYSTSQMIVDTVMLNITHIGSKNITFKLDANENLPVSLVGDEPRIKQILNNFLSNAFKYTDEGVVTLAIGKVGSKNPDEVLLTITVSDTGQGMTSEQITNLFESEYTRFNIQANRAVEGTGLGMSIARRIITMMNGTVSVKSEPGEGSTFIIKIPQKLDGPEVLGAEAVEKLKALRLTSEKKVSHAGEPMPYGKVLAVDDIESNLYVIEGYLAPYQINLESVLTGQEAIDKVNAGNVYDIIFMDHMMPDMDGLEATKILRDNGYTAPIVALTANTLKGARELFMKNGFTGFIAKPINLLQLHSYLMRYVRDKQPPEVLEAARANAREISPMADAPKVSEKVFASFLRDAAKALEIMQTAMAREELEADEIRAFAIQAHGMKSALANVEKYALSDDAKFLETAANGGNVQAIFEKTPAFIKGVQLVMSELAPPEDAAATDSDPEFLSVQLKIIADACENYDKKTAGAALKNLRQKQWSAATNALIAEIDAKILHADFEAVVEIIQQG